LGIGFGWGHFYLHSIFRTAWWKGPNGQAKKLLGIKVIKLDGKET